MTMTFDDYEALAAETAIYADAFYPFFGLAEEAGEVCGKMAKIVRGDVIDLPDEFLFEELPEHLKRGFAKELGDCLWMITRCATELGMSLEDVARLNTAKLLDRQIKGTLHGEGDDR